MNYLFLLTNHNIYVKILQRILCMAEKHIYREDLYLSESIDVTKLDKIKKTLERRPLVSGVFVIAISQNTSDQLDIISSKMLTQRYYVNNPLTIVGLAKSNEEALSVVKRIVEDCMKVRGDCAIKEYLLCGI